MYLSSEKSKIWKISFSPKISDLDEIGEVVNITLGMFQVMIINQFPIEKSTEFTLSRDFSKPPILALQRSNPHRTLKCSIDAGKSGNT